MNSQGQQNPEYFRGSVRFSGTEVKMKHGPKQEHSVVSVENVSVELATRRETLAFTERSDQPLRRDTLAFTEQSNSPVKATTKKKPYFADNNLNHLDELEEKQTMLIRIRSQRNTAALLLGVAIIALIGLVIGVCVSSNRSAVRLARVNTLEN